ncbi:MAG: hypothetical protein GY757_14555 [bacterium]|nr:hypothetical protein [bacterium]
MSDIRFLFDENVNPILRQELLISEPKIIAWKIGDPGAPPLGTKDPEILCWCEKNAFILLTYNRKSMPQHILAHLQQGKHVPGILELNSNMSMGETIEELVLIWQILEPKNFKDLILYLPI